MAVVRHADLAVNNSSREVQSSNPLKQIAQFAQKSKYTFDARTRRKNFGADIHSKID
jgi:hypothetical protein